MAVASLDHTRVVAYALEHGTSAAARRFRVSDSYVRRLRREAGMAGVVGRPSARLQELACRPGLRVVAAPSVPMSGVTHLQLLPANMVARRGTLWRCPLCHELVRVPAGAVWNNWIKQDKCLHDDSVAVITPAVSVLASPLESAAPVPVSEIDNNALERDKTVFENRNDISAAVIAPMLDSSQISPVLTSSRWLSDVMCFLLPWLAEYWRFVLGFVLGLALLLYLS